MYSSHYLFCYVCYLFISVRWCTFGFSMLLVVAMSIVLGVDGESLTKKINFDP